jgi:hypothetical protein
MELMKRYAVYFAPREGAFAARAAEWLGRDAVTGQALKQPDLPGIDAAAITKDPRRYGFHGTIRAPFRPAYGMGLVEVAAAVALLATRLAPVVCPGLQIQNLQGFLALIPEGSDVGLMTLAASVVEATNALRQPLSDADMARRRPETLTQRQRDLLMLWGYPYVMEEFRFHLTLTDRLNHPDPVMAALRAHFAPVLPRPFVIEDLCLFGEDDSGVFHLLHRYALSG